MVLTGDLEFAIEADEQVLRFDVAMENVLGMKVLERDRHLKDVPRRISFTEAADLLELLVELTSWRVFQYEVDVRVVPEVRVHRQDVLVVDARLDLDLPPQLVFNVRPNQFCLP